MTINKRRTSPKFHENIVGQDMPAINLEEPLKFTIEKLDKCHCILEGKVKDKGDRDADVLAIAACSGKGKTRFLFELKSAIETRDNEMCIPITFNGDQKISKDLAIVHKKNDDYNERAVVHLVLRLLHSTFEVGELGTFAKSAATALWTLVPTDFTRVLRYWM